VGRWRRYNASVHGRAPAQPASVSEDAGSALPAGPRYRRLRREDLQVIAYRHVRGASDGEIARELGVDRSSVRGARKRPAGLELIAAERKREAKRAESQRYRDRKKQQRELAARAIPEAEEAAESGQRASSLGSRSRPAGATAAEGRPQAGGRLRVSGNRDAYEAWLNERDARVPLTRADLYSRNDDAAARVVAAGGGMQAVIEATGLRTRENVLRLIDPAILDEARQNDAAPAAAAESADLSPSMLSPSALDD